MNIYLTVVIPCYNELANLKRGVLDQVESYLKEQDFSWEVIISDDASTDGSLDFVQSFVQTRPKFRLLKNPKGGKAFAVKSAVEKAMGEYVLFTDMDQSTPITEFDKLKSFLDQGCQVVIGSRGFKRENFPLLRQIASPLFLTFRRLLILRNIHDTQCGFKCFKTELVLKVFQKLYVFKRPPGKGWRVGAWDVELLFVALKSNPPFKEITVEWSDTDTSTSKQRKFIRESIEMLTEVMRVRVNDLLGRYEI